MKRLILGAVLVMSTSAFGDEFKPSQKWLDESKDWAEDQKWASGPAPDVDKAFQRSKPLKVEVLHTDRKGNVVNPKEIGRRPGGWGLGAAGCYRVVVELAELAAMQVNPDARVAKHGEAVKKIMQGLETVYCGFARYYRGDREDDLKVPSGTYPGGNPEDKNEAESDIAVTFEPASGPTLKSMHVYLNRHANSQEAAIVYQALKKRFPDLFD